MFFKNQFYCFALLISFTSCFRETSTYKWSYDENWREAEIPGNYSGETRDRYSHDRKGSPHPGETVYLELNKNHKCIYKTESFYLFGNWQLKYDTLNCFFTKSNGSGRKKRIGENVNFDQSFLVNETNCLVPITGRVKFCKEE